MENSATEMSKTPRFTTRQIATLAVRVGVVVVAVGTIAYVSNKRKNAK
jgi:hypothetical protein